jgi:hypothetical protein
MKILIAILLILASSATFACVNLSGQYQTQVGATYSIEQHTCTDMNVLDKAGSTQMRFDGVEKLYYEYDLASDEGAILGHIQVFLSSKIDNSEWIYNERDVVTYTDGQVATDSKWAEVSFTEVLKHL